MKLTKSPKKRNQRLYMACPSCDSFDIVHDFVHAEYYCQDCGLVISTYNCSKWLNIANFKPKPKNNCIVDINIQNNLLL